MRTPTRRKSNKAQNSVVRSLPAPVGGWNARDSLADMDPRDARKLVNWFPTTTDCELRGGQTDYATSITGLVETLAVYNKLDGTSEMFAVDSNDVWDVSSSGVASAQSTTVTNGRWQYLNFGDGTNEYLVMVNGVDAPLYYNGTTWTVITGVSSPALTGVTLTSLVHVNEYKGRLIFVEKDTLSFWYLAAQAAGGALTEFPLDSLANRGGYLMWSATWSFDSGDGPDDAAVFITSEGEVIVYRGTDPSTAANWVLAGVYFIGKPLGRRSFVKMAGDLVVITQDGAFPLSASLQSSTIDNTVALSNKIKNDFNVAARDYGANFGWEAINYPLRSAMIFNIPLEEDGMHSQYVMNTITGAWCEFDSWDAECFAEYNDEIYYGLTTEVRKAWTGSSDDGANIIALGKTAFNYFGNTSQQKRFTMFRPMIEINGSLSFLTGMDVDFSNEALTGLATSSGVTGDVWDTGLWDTAVWSGGSEIVREWRSPSNNVGYCASVGVQTETANIEIKWIANDYVFEHGGVL